VKEKLFVKPWKKWLNITSRKERRMKQLNSCLRCRTKVRGVAHLTSCFALPVGVGVARYLSNKNEKQDRQAKCNYPSQTSSRL
jgi:hypothetical protein